MLKFIDRVYHVLVTLPDRLYPFASEIEGHFVRGQRSYANALKKAFDTYGPGRFGYKLTLYRSTFHFLGSILFILVAAFISHTFFKGEAALYVLLFAAVAALSFQEFYMHPRRYGQRTRKGLVDWVAWVLPIVTYVSLFTLS